jgi:hypothetical protein
MDVPAAHSMDSSWFAVDQDGAVAVFDTGEGGALPSADRFPKGGEAGGDDGIDPFRTLVLLIERRAARDPELARVLGEAPDWKEKLEAGLMEMEEPDRDEVAAWVGLYWYSCTEPLAAPFVRSVVVPRPLPVAEWPSDLAARLRGAGLPVRFAEHPAVAPGEHVAVESWDHHWLDRAGKLHRTDGRPVDPRDLATFESVGMERAPLPTIRTVRSDDVLRALIADTLRAAMEAPPPMPQPDTGLWSRIKRLFS